MIGVPLNLAPKLARYPAMRESGLSETVVRHMLDPRHATRPERIQAALAALGKWVAVTFEDAA